MSDYLRARDALLAVRDIPGGQGLACLLADQIGDLSQHGAMVGSTLQAEMLVKSVSEAWRTERRDEQGRWTDTSGVTALTAAEEHALTTWTGAQSASIRKGYEDGIPQTDLAKEFDRAIRKLPAESGTFWRGINIDLQARDLPNFIAPETWDKRLAGLSEEEQITRWEAETAWPQYWAPHERVTAPEDVARYWKSKMGEPMVWGQPSSSMPNPEGMEKFSLGPGARTVFKIERTARARDVSGFAMNREAWEAEHVIPPGQFKIVAVDIGDYKVVDAFSHDYGKTIPIVTVHVQDVTGAGTKAIGGFVLESLKAYDPLQPRQPRGTEHGGEWTRLQHARGPFAPRRLEIPEGPHHPANGGPSPADGSSLTPVGGALGTSGVGRKPKFWPERGEWAIRKLNAEHPFGLHVEDEHSDKVQAAVYDYYRLPEPVRHEIEENARLSKRNTINVNDRTLLDFPEFAATVREGEQPRGWSPGSTWQHPGGVYSTRLGKVFIAGDGTNNGSRSVMIHEIGHAIQHTLEMRPDLMPASAKRGNITSAQNDTLDLSIERGSTYEGMYDGRYPVVRRPGGEEGGIGPNAPIYDWIDTNGRMQNLQYEPSAPPGGYDESKWKRKAPRPAVEPSFLTQLQAHHRRLFDRLTPYEQQDGPGSVAGCEELFAESMAEIVVADSYPRDSPARRQPEKTFDKEYVAWMHQMMRAYSRGLA